MMQTLFIFEKEVFCHTFIVDSDEIHKDVLY